MDDNGVTMVLERMPASSYVGLYQVYEEEIILSKPTFCQNMLKEKRNFLLLYWKLLEGYNGN
jgi:hypothetical protein